VLKQIKIKKLFFICVLFIFSSTGCDIVSSITENFKKNTDKTQKNTLSGTATSQSTGTTEHKNVSDGPISAENLLASVGNWQISIDEFNERLKALKEVMPEYDTNAPEAKKLVLDELINQQLLVQSAEETGLTQEKDVVLALEEFRRTLLVREVVRKLTENIQVSDDEIRAFYDEKKDMLLERVEYHVREIVVDSQTKANEILVEILKGVDFAEMAKQNSRSKTAEKGGDLGFIQEVPFPQMGNALLSLEDGAVSSVFKGPEGYYIVKLEEKKGGKQIPFEDIKEDILKNQTVLKQQQVIVEYINQQKEKVKIVVNEDLLK